VIGFVILIVYTNALTVYLGLIAIIVYVILYAVAKRRSVHGTVVGSIAGALPPVAGYTAYSHQFTSAAGLLFLIMVCWQMPHFYAIAMYRFKDYKAAHIPVLPVQKGLRTTKQYIVVYIIGFMLAVSLLSVLGYTGYTFLIVMELLGGAWLTLAVSGFQVVDDTSWARRMFFFSLIVTLALSLMLAVGGILP